MTPQELKADPKEIFNKGYNRRLRKNNKIPAVVYDHKGNNKHLIIDHNEFERVFRSARSHGIINLKYNEIEDKVLVRDYQIEPVQKKFNHVDFFRISDDHQVKAKIPVVFTGSPIGVKQGGIQENLMLEVAVKCFPKDLIDKIELDISTIGINEGIQIKELELGEQILILNKPDQYITRVIQSRTSKMEEMTAEGPVGAVAEEAAADAEDAAE